MKKLQVLAAAAVIGAMSMSVQADNSWFVQYSSITLDGDIGDASPAAIELGYAYGVADNIDIDGYVGMGMGDDDGVEVALSYGLGATYNYEASDVIGLSASLTYNYLEVEIDTPFGTLEGDDSEVGFGVGAEYAVGSGAITLDYTARIEDVTAISLGYKMDI